MYGWPQWESNPSSILALQMPCSTALPTEHAGPQYGGAKLRFQDTVVVWALVEEVQDLHKALDVPRRERRKS